MGLVGCFFAMLMDTLYIVVAVLHHVQTCMLAEQDTEAEAIYAMRKEALHRELK
jgi:hypothetical protein